MSTTVQNVTMYGTNLDGTKFPYQATVSERYFQTKDCGKFFAKQVDTGRGISTELYKVYADGSKKLMKDKLEGCLGNIYRQKYDWLSNDRVSVSCVPKKGTGDFYFWRIGRGKNNQEVITDLLSGHMLKSGDTKLLTLSKIDSSVINNAGRELGGGAKPILNRIAKGLLTALKRR